MLVRVFLQDFCPFVYNRSFLVLENCFKSGVFITRITQVLSGVLITLKYSLLYSYIICIRTRMQSSNFYSMNKKW